MLFTSSGVLSDPLHSVSFICLILLVFMDHGLLSIHQASALLIPKTPTRIHSRFVHPPVRRSSSSPTTITTVARSTKYSKYTTIICDGTMDSVADNKENSTIVSSSSSSSSSSKIEDNKRNKNKNNMKKSKPNQNKSLSFDKKKKRNKKNVTYQTTENSTTNPTTTNTNTTTTIGVASDRKKSDTTTTTITSKETTTTTTATTTTAIMTTKDKFEQKINEMVQKGKRGGNITQAYCDSMLALCVASDEWDSVMVILAVMKQYNLTQEHSSYQACLQACFEVGNGASAKEILSAMDSALVTPTPSDVALVIGAMCRNEKTDPGVWWRRGMALIRITSQQLQEQSERGEDMSSLVLPVDAYDAVLSCMIKERQWKDAIRLLRQMEQLGTHPAPQLSTYRTVIECCLSANQAEQAFQVLYSMTERGIKPTVYAFELVISALCKKLQWRRALQLMDMMDDLEVPKTVLMYNSVISACARAKEVGTAKSLLVKMRKQGMPPDVISFNSVISACASIGRWKDALTVLDQCYREPGVTPDIYTYTNAIRACAKGGKTNRALTLLQVVKDKNLPIDSYCYTAVIDACAKARLWRKALELLVEMQENDIEPTQVTYSVVISACGNGGQWRKALELLQLMRDEGMSVNLITYNAAITALAKASRRNARTVSKYRNHLPSSESSEEEGLWTRAVFLLEQMKEDGIQPDGFSFTSAISCCGAEGRWEEALALMKVMKKGGPRTRPNKIAYTAAISACGRAGEADIAVDLFRSMKNEGLSADGVAYNALFSALRVAGRPDMAYELWGELCGTRSTNTTAIATARDTATPDIITVTECLDTLSRAQYTDKLDEVFEEAVKRHIVLGRDTLDSKWDSDLSGMSFPVARAACRYIIRRAQRRATEGKEMEDISLITGVGRAQQQRKSNDEDEEIDQNSSLSKASSSQRFASTSLRDYAQEVLEKDFIPPIHCTIPKFSQGTVVVEKQTFQKWLDQQEQS